MTHSAVFFAVKIPPIDHTCQRRHVPAGDVKPAGSFLNAVHPAAVCAGNTETTQRVCDTVLKAFALFAPDRIPAASQGTMNLIGIGGVDPRSGRAYTYIETIAGGQGGRPMGDGQDGVQCNMTNTMNTPIEALEITYPLRVERYELRENSAGTGRHRGGMGVVRSFRVLDHQARISLIRSPPARPVWPARWRRWRTRKNIRIDNQGIRTACPGKAS
jgi:N-methylhydantoinase B